MGSEQSTEASVLKKRTLELFSKVVVVEGKRKTYTKGNLIWAARLLCTLAERRFPQSIDDLKGLIQVGEQHPVPVRDLQIAVETLKVFVVLCLGMKVKNTNEGVVLYNMAVRKAAPEHVPRDPPSEEEARRIEAAYPVQATPQGPLYTAMNPRMIQMWADQVRAHGLCETGTVTFFAALTNNLTLGEIVLLMNSTPDHEAEKAMLLSYLEEKAEEWERNAPRPLQVTKDELLGRNINVDNIDPRLDIAKAWLKNTIVTGLMEVGKKVLPTPHATKIMQGTKEPYKDFIDRLYAAIAKENLSPDITRYLQQSLSIANANPDCKRRLASLRPEDDLEDKIRACADFMSPEKKMVLLAEAITRGLRGDRGNSREVKRGKNPPKCFKCLKMGHLARDCRGQLTCRNCQRTGHMARNCPNGKSGQRGPRNQPSVNQVSQEENQRGRTTERSSRSEGLYPLIPDLSP